MTTDLTTLKLAADAQDLLFRQARTATAFTDQPVSAAQIHEIYNLIRLGPTALNSQPLRILLLTTASARARLLPHMSSGNRAKTAAAPLVAVLAADTAFAQRLPHVFPHRPEAQNWFTDEDHRESHARFNATLQIGYLLIGVRAAGLAIGPMAGFNADAVDREYFPDGRLRSLLVVNIGRPAPQPWRDRLPRLSPDDAVLEA
jgi:3-hydroxypropanoate dehydrogenase